MIGGVGVHRANDAQLIDIAGELRKELAHLGAALSMMGEFERRLHQIAFRLSLALGSERLGQRLAVELFQARLGVEGVNVRGTAVHEQKNQLLRAGRKMRWLYGEGIDRAGGRERRRG